MNFEHLQDDKLDVMNFLNEVAIRYPDAISFASGRPKEDFFSIGALDRSFDVFKQSFIATEGIDSQRADNIIGQYGKTAGMINGAIRQHLLVDEDIICEESQILVTNGCQEALTLLLMAGCQGKALLVTEPTYIGITGLAKILNIACFSVSSEEDLVSERGISNAVKMAADAGKDVAALYLIPNFDNPSGDSMSLSLKHDILAYCYKHNIDIFEDNPYGLFYFDEHKAPTMFQLDEHGIVYYLGSFAKTLCPTLRIGFIVAPETCASGVKGKSVITELAKVKSFVSVNTSQITQGIAAGQLQSCNYNLTNYVSDARQFYKHNREAMLNALTKYFDNLSGKVSWNKPAGGFFITVRLPFVFTNEDVSCCAETYNILVMPRAYFSLLNKQDEYVRLSFSYITAEQIEKGVKLFSQFVQQKLEGKHVS